MRDSEPSLTPKVATGARRRAKSILLLLEDRGVMRTVVSILGVILNRMSFELLLWADRHPVPLYQSGLWPGGYASTVVSQHPHEFHQPRSEVLEGHTYQYHFCGPTPRYNSGLPRNSQPWSTYSVAEYRVADPPPSDESLFGSLDGNGMHASMPSYHIARGLLHEPSGAPVDCPSPSPSMFTTSSSIDVTEETSLSRTVGPQR